MSTSRHHSSRNPIVILMTYYRLMKIPKLVIANDEPVATAWPSILLLLPGIRVSAFEILVIVPSDIC